MEQKPRDETHMSTHPRIYPDRPLSDIPDDARGVFLRITASEVLNQQIGRCVDELMHLSDHPERVKRLMCGLIIEVEGLEEDARELHNIPECRRFFKALFTQWPHWMHFLAPLPDQWRTLALCVLTPESVGVDAGAGSGFTDESFRSFVRSLVNGSDQLQLAAGVSETDRAASMVVSLRTLSEVVNAGR